MNKLILITLAAAGMACAQTTATGTLTVAGKTSQLTQVYAWAEAGFFDKTKDDTIVVLTDGPVPEKTLHDHFGLQKLAADGKICYVQATINASGQVINYQVGHKAFKMPPSGGSTEHVFEGKIQPASIGGKVFTKGVQEAAFEKTKYEYSATFRAPVQPKK